MTQPPSPAVASPCINVCRMHEGSGWCEGCLRTLDEIAAWSRLDDAAKRAVLARLPERRRAWRLLKAKVVDPAAPDAAAPDTTAVAPSPILPSTLPPALPPALPPRDSP